MGVFLPKDEAARSRCVISNFKYFLLLGFAFLPVFTVQSRAASLEELKKRLPMIPEVDGASLSSLELGCRKTGAELPGYYTCESQNGKPGFKSRVEFNVRNMVASLVENLYAGVSPNTLGASKVSATPVCNLSQGENDKDYKGRSCGSFCDLKLDTGLLGGGVLHVNDKNGHCDREYGWLRGGQIQAIYDSYEKVIQSFKSGNYVLLSVDGVHPNGEYASDIYRVQTVHQKILEEIIAKKGEEKVSKLVCRNRDLAGGTNAFNIATPESHGACRLKMGGMELVAMWSKFLVSEIQWKASLALDEVIGQDQNRFFQEISQGAQKRCEAEVSCGVTCSDEEMNKRLKPCYQREVKRKIEEIFAPLKAPKINRQAKPVTASSKFRVKGVVV